MNIHTKEEIIKIIQEDEWMMNILRSVREAHVPDWYIGAGFVRSKVWDAIHDLAPTKVPDIDVIYFDADGTETKTEEEYEALFSKAFPEEVWSFTNQATIHPYNNDEPYVSTEDAFSKWVETATCVAVRLEEDDTLTFVAAHGIEDLVNCIARPSPHMKDKPGVFKKRMEEKQWQKNGQKYK